MSITYNVIFTNSLIFHSVKAIETAVKVRAMMIRCMTWLSCAVPKNQNGWMNLRVYPARSKSKICTGDRLVWCGRSQPVLITFYWRSAETTPACCTISNNYFDLPLTLNHFWFRFLLSGMRVTQFEYLYTYWPRLTCSSSCHYFPRQGQIFVETHNFS